MKIINRATEYRIRQLVQSKHYTYRHIQLLVEFEGLGRPSLSYIGKVKKLVIKKK